MPDLKAPAVVADLYYDLRDRRLLPLLALVLVAIVATPFLLGQGSGEVEEAIPVPAAIQALKESGGRRASTLTVVEANPGLRDYRKRLRGRKPLDPFRTFGKPSLKGAQLGGKSEGEGKGSSGSSAPLTSTSTTVKETKEGSKTTSTTKTTTTTGGSGEGSGGNGGSNGGSHAGGGAQTQTYTIDVQISTASETGATAEPAERLNVQPLTPLPGKATPVVTYLGPSSGATKALFSVSKEVSAVFGEAKCVSGADTCEAIELEPDFPVTFVYGPSQTRYKIKLLKIKPAKDAGS
jgi:hypothetical protein